MASTRPVRPVAPALRRPGRGTLLALLLAGLACLWLIGSALWTDSLWFSSLGFGSVFATQLGAQVVLGLAGAMLIGGLPLLAALLAYRFRSRQGRRPRTTIAVGTGARRGLFLVPAAVLAVMGAMGAAPQAPSYLAWAHRTPFGVRDATFGLDASFYVFSYPWYRFVVSGLSTALMLSLVATLAVVYLTGGVVVEPGPQGRPRPRLTGPAAAQLSAFAALLCLTYGLDRLLDRFGLPLSEDGLFTGVTYADANARVTSTLVVAIIAFLCAALFAVNVVLRRWIAPVTAVVLLVVSGLVLSVVYPGLLQALVVRPSEPDKEAPYVARHVAATRAAYGIDGVEIADYAARTTATSGQLHADADALPGIRLMDPAVVGQTFDQLQQVRGYYTFPRLLDVDRYHVDGRPTDVVVAVREIDPEGLPDANWNNVHTVFTHGYGLVGAYGNRRQPGGEPEWLSRDIPPVGKLPASESRVYFGELATSYVVVGARPGAAPLELDTPGGAQGGGEQSTTYDGAGGVPIGSPLRRLAYATRFADANLLLSDRVHADSKVLYDRTPLERVQQVAPWLTLDADPYPTLVDGRLTWVVDGYTTTANYPDSQRLDLRATTTDRQSRLSTARLPEQRLNYLRNAVKATVDAYDGTVTLYAWDEADPLLQTWRKAFPGTVKDRDEISPALREHLRYPEDLFKVQRQVLGRYHQTNPHTWYNSPDLWVVPQDPVAAKEQGDQRGRVPLEAPYFLTIRWPGDEDPVFSMTSVFVPNNRNNLAAYLSVVADATSPDYGRLRVLRMSDSQQIDGPGQSFNAMTTNPAVAEALRPFLNQGSAAASFGNLLTIPLGGGLLYAVPVYTQREAGGSSSYPALRFVIVRFGEHVAIADTLQEALDDVFQGDAGGDTREGTSAEPGGQKPTVPQQGPEAVKAALQEAEAAFAAADAALKAGDLAEYQRQLSVAKAAVERAARANG